MSAQRTITVDLFLRAPAYSAATIDRTPAVVFWLGEREGLVPNGLRASWLGTEAAQFLAQHAADLKPGRGLRLALHSIHASGSELRARVATCELLDKPESWIKHEQQAHAADTHQPPTQAQPA